MTTTSHPTTATQPGLLYLSSSLFGSAGASSQLAAEYIARWQQRHPDGAVRVRDLAADPVPHLDAARFQAFVTPAGQRSPAQQAVIDFSEQLIGELEAADTVVLGLPMYNFGEPSVLKAYFDHIARAGRTFRYTASGPEGLLKGKRAIVFATRGGRYAGTPLDTQSGWVRNFLAFVGIVEVEFVYAEGLATGADARGAALQQAQRELQALAA